MTWLSTLLRGNSAAKEAVIEPAPEPAAPPSPQLALLVPSVAGVSSYRLHTFADADSAAQFAVSSFNAFLRGNIQAFWALHQQPDAATATDAERRGEALVIIREAAGSSVVYAVSFVDIESALAFARFEVERGLDPSLLLLYWASLVELQEEPDGVRFQPSCPPATARREALAAPAAEPQPQEVQSFPPRTVPAAAPDETLHEEYSWPAPVSSVPAPTDTHEQPREERAALEAYRQQLQGTGLLVEEPPPKQPVPAEQRGQATNGADAPAMAPAALLKAARWPEATEADVEPRVDSAESETPADAGEHAQEVRLLLLPPPEAAPDVAEELGAVVELPAVPAETWVEPSAALRDGHVAEVGTSTPPPPSVEDLDCASGADIATVAEKLLQHKRWEQRQTPFRGFGSPPGRF